MADHLHLVLDLDDCEPIGLALPVDAGTGGASALRFREELVGAVNGVNRVFTTSQMMDRSTVGTEEWVLYNGKMFSEGLSSDYVVSESGGVGTGYDTVTFVFAPKPGDKLEAIYIPTP